MQFLYIVDFLVRRDALIKEFIVFKINIESKKRVQIFSGSSDPCTDQANLNIDLTIFSSDFC